MTVPYSIVNVFINTPYMNPINSIVSYNLHKH